MQELANRKEYSEDYDRMKWLLPKQAEAAASTRNSLVDLIASHPESNWVYSQTKLYTHAISPGCALCGQGEWSCLFINGICSNLTGWLRLKPFPRAWSLIFEVFDVSDNFCGFAFAGSLLKSVWLFFHRSRQLLLGLLHSRC